ncbi:MAG: dienelactone hydrolase family protein [Mariprofundaceae bacterium]
MKTHLLPAVELQTGAKPSATVIWLHGLGADGHDFEPIVPELNLPDALSVRFVFPHAPSIPVSINSGYIMPAWYDIKHADIGYEQDERGILESSRLIQMMIDREEMHGIASSRIILAGFSQGGAMALHVGLRQGESLAGILALSCYLPLAESIEQEMRSETVKSPIFMAHGVEDPVVPFELGDHSHHKLQSLGYAVEWHSYPMEHTVCHEEIIKIGQWITSVLKE